jgi:hypothetical protein
VDRFDIRIQADQRNLTPKTIKAKKADIRPNVSKLYFRIFRGLTMVSQHSKGLYIRKIKKGQIFFSKAIAKATAPFIEIL